MHLPLLKGKYGNRIGAVLLHAFSQLLPGIANLVLSLLIVRLFVPQWWGQIAALQLYQYLVVQVVAWGNKDVLLRSFSNEPSAWRHSFSSSFIYRSWLLLPVVAATFVLYGSTVIFVHLSIWICCRFVQQSFEAPALFQRTFSVIIASEIVAMVVMMIMLLLFQDASFHTILLVISIGQLIRTAIQLIVFRTWISHTGKVFPRLSFFASSFPFMLLGLLGILQQKTDLLWVIRFTDDLQVARYQVFTTFYLLALSIPMLIAGPFVKNVYRISVSTLGKVQLVFAAAGASINLFIMLAAYVVIEYSYLFHVDPVMYVLAWLSATVAYLFSLKIIRLFRSERQWLVLAISFAAVALNSVLCVLLLPVCGLTGALIANASAQVSLLGMFRVTGSCLKAEA